MYLLDTNTLIYFFKGKGNIAHHLFATAPNDIFIPSIVIYELQVGIAKSTNSTKRQKQLQTLLDAVNVINFTANEAKHSALIRAALEAKGTPIGPMDTLIAGCAVANNLTLVTRNTKEFNRIQNLSITNWYQ